MTRLRPLAATAALAVMGLALMLITPAGAQQLSDRAKQIGGKFMCMCGCSQVLTECNHVGCTVSASMLKDLNAALDRGESEDQITQMFLQQYGTKVYAEPPKSGFSLVAWAMPTVYLVLGTVFVIFVISRWRKHSVEQVSAARSKPAVSPELLERARAQAARETED